MIAVGLRVSWLAPSFGYGNATMRHDEQRAVIEVCDGLNGVAIVAHFFFSRCG